jgi:branched-chain amino acid transport system substrate-binding protein
MENSYVKSGVVGVLLVIMILMGLCPAAVASDPIKVGLLAPMTGPSPDWGKKQLLAMEMAVENVNLRGGVNGTPVEMYALDTGGNPEKAMEAYKELAESNRVLGVIGPLMSATFAALQPLTNEEKVCIIATASAKPGLSDLQKYPYAFRMTMTSAKSEGASAKAWLKAHGIKTVALVYEAKDPYCAAIGKMLWPKMFEGINVKVLDADQPITFTRGETAFAEPLSRLKALNPEGICIAAMPTDGARFLKALRGVGLEQPVLGSSSVATETLISMADKDAEGVVSNTLFNPGDPNPKVVSYVKAFTERCQKTYTDVSCQSGSV